MEDYDSEYGKLMKMKNITAPLHLFKDDENIVCGYLFKCDDDYIDLDKYLKSEDEDIQINDFLNILSGICDCFIDILRCGLKPCSKNNTIMVLSNENEEISVLFTGSDELLSCKDDIEEETVREITKFFNVESIPRDIKNSYEFKKIFNLTDDTISLKNNIVTVKGLKEIINKLIK
jgi:hypothetical protein